MGGIWRSHVGLCVNVFVRADGWDVGVPVMAVCRNVSVKAGGWSVASLVVVRYERLGSESDWWC